MVEGVERFEPIFELEALAQAEHLKQRSVEVLNRLRALGVAPDCLCVGEPDALNYINVIGRNATFRIGVLKPGGTDAGRHNHGSRIVCGIGISYIRAITRTKTISLPVRSVQYGSRRPSLQENTS